MKHSVRSRALAGLAAWFLPIAPAFAEPVTDEVIDEQQADEIIVLGKSYGQAVGKTVTPLKDVPDTITVIDQEQLQQWNLFTLEDALTITNGWPMSHTSYLFGSGRSVTVVPWQLCRVQARFGDLRPVTL